MHALKGKVASGHRHRGRIGSRLDPVGQNAMVGAVEAGHALDLDCGGARAADARAHLVEAGGEIHDLGLAGGVADLRRPVRGRRGHQRHVRSADRHLRKLDLSPGQTVGRLGDRIAAVDVDLRAELLKRHQQEIDRPGADRAAARQRHARRAHSRDERRDHPEAGAHLRHQFIRRRGVDDGAGAQMRGLAGPRVLADPLAVDRIVDAVIAEDMRKLGDVGEAGQVFERQRLIRQQRGDHQRQRGVFRARNRDHPVQRRAAANLYAIHPLVPLAQIKSGP